MKKQLTLVYSLIIFGLTCLIIFLSKLLLAYPFFSSIKQALINVFVPFFISFIFVYIFQPVLIFIERKFAIKTTVSTFILLALNALFFIAIINVMLPIIGRQIIDIITDFPNLEAQLTEFINSFSQNEAIKSMLLTIKDSILNQIDAQFVNLFVSRLIQFTLSLWIIFIIPIIIFLMTRDYGLIHNKMEIFLKKYEKNEYTTLLYTINKQLGTYIRGQFFITFYMFLGTYLLLVIINMPNAFIFALTIALTSFIPYFGPFLGGIPLVAYGFYQSTELLIGSLIVIFIMQLLDSYIGEPLVFGRHLRIHPLLILIVMLLGWTISGIIGVLFSVPIFIIIRAVVIFIYVKGKNNVSKKEIEQRPIND